MSQSRVEPALLGLIAVVCAVLSILQYRWTGEVSHAELARLRAGLDEQVPRLALAFNNDISESCRALLPDSTEIRDEGMQQAHRSRYREWASSHERGLFARIGIAASEKGTLNLYGLDGEGRMALIEWPPNWAALRAQMTARMQGGGQAPSVPADSTLIELPVFGGSGGRRGPRQELEWMIFEVSEQHLRSKTLPRMVEEYLSSGEDAVYDLSVTWADPGRPAVFSTRPDKSSVVPGADFTKEIFPIHAFEPSRGRRGGRFRDNDSRPRWVLAVRHRAGSLDAAVARTRFRNLATSLVLIGLMGGAAWALVRYTARSRRLAEMQFRFAVGVSHDLRTPLTAIRGAAFNLSDGLVKEPAAIERYAKLILRNAEELTSMIENVLAFSANPHSGKEARMEPFAVGDLLDHAATALAGEAEQAGCRIEVTVTPDLPSITGDPIALEHAFRNLIANAARYAAQGKWIGVSAARFADGVEVRVCDRGPGIPEADLKHVFEPFYRGGRTRASRVRGTGLGLSLVKETVERHRGTVAVHNSPAGGAVFTVRLPAIPELS